MFDQGEVRVFIEYDKLQAVTGCPLPPWAVMALYSHSKDIEDFESDWYPTILLAPINEKLYIGAQELSKDDGWNQEECYRLLFLPM